MMSNCNLFLHFLKQQNKGIDDEFMRHNNLIMYENQLCKYSPYEFSLPV